jgi:tripartite-type tricarboxylate transporter receptor subunit TctC
MSRTNSVRLPFLSLFGLAMMMASASAQKLPDQIKIVNTTAAGGGSDTALRIISHWIGENKKQTIVIEARPGGSGAVAMNSVKPAAPDGGTLVVCDSTTLATNIWLYKKLAYNPADYEPITTQFSFPVLLSVAAVSPANSLADLIAIGKSRPQGLNYGSQGISSGGHLMGAWLAKVGGFTGVHVPFRGSAPAVTELLANRLDLVWSSYPAVKSFYESKQLKLLATTSEARLPTLPEVATVGELGFPQLAVNFWFGLCAPLNTPPSIVNSLYEMFSAAVKAPSVQDALRVAGIAPQSENPAEFKELIAKDRERVRPIVEATGTQLD